MLLKQDVQCGMYNGGIVTNFVRNITRGHVLLTLNYGVCIIMHWS